jgi:hypothetical protein
LQFTKEITGFFTGAISAFPTGMPVAPAYSQPTPWGVAREHQQAYRQGDGAGGETCGRNRMDENLFQKKLAELVQEIGTLPESERTKLEDLAEESKQRQKKLKRTVSSLQDSIDYLRLSIKYLLFDLEATRRENGYLRKMLEEEPEV